MTEELQTTTDNLRKFGTEFQTKCISALLSDRSFIERIDDILEVGFFEGDAHKWIAQETITYYHKYKDLPTLTTFKVQVDAVKNDVLKHSIITTLKIVYQKLNDTDLLFVKETFLEFCKNQKLKQAIMASVDYLQGGNYEQIKLVVDEAMKAGMERNLGHDYFEEVEHRMHVMARNTIKTNWVEVDTILDGGLGPGELGVIAAPAGAGKCVGPNTEIEIEYHEFGLELTNANGNSFIMWISPFDTYNLDGKELYGWQVENIFFEIEKMKEAANIENK